MKHKDFPFDECAAAAYELHKEGAIIHQKFTCSRCGSRQTISEANKFFTSGLCEKCGHTTDIRARGCNYLIIWGSLP